MRLLFYFSSFVCFFFINFLFVLMYHRLLSFFFLSFCFLFLFFVFCVNYRFLFPVDITTRVKWEIGLFEVSSLTIRSVFLFLYFFVWNGREQRLAFLTRHITADSADSAQFSVFWMSFFFAIHAFLKQKPVSLAWNTALTHSEPVDLLGDLTFFLPHTYPTISEH